MEKRDLAKDLFSSYKTGYIKKQKVIREVNPNPTDPQLISDVLKNLIQDREWQSGIAEGNLFVICKSLLVEQLSIIGPQGPSWKRGIRTIKGARGPRDTFG